ncbi:MAG: glycosyltransferase [Pseudomonadota bacterium]
MKTPKKIHYCWYGRGPLSEKQKMCIASWQAVMPEYELVLWNEDNSPMDNAYLRNALAHQKWANASNFLRLYALEKLGGLYFDTDVQALRSFDPLLKHDCFLGFQYDHNTSPKKRLNRSINNAISGAAPGHPFVRQCLEQLQERFDGTEPADQSGPHMASDILVRQGLTDYSPTPITIAGCTIFPADYFSPYFYGEAFDLSCITDNTFTLHHWDASWVKKPTTPKGPDPDETASRDRKIKDLTELATALRSERDAVLSSRSWKITRPLRRLAGLIQR